MRTFVDTNIIVYALDEEGGENAGIAAERLEALWHSRQGVISTQVLIETYAVLNKKSRRMNRPGAALAAVKPYQDWDVVVPDVAAVLDAMRLHETWQTSFWDALIIKAASLADCRILLTEDLQHGRKIGALTVVNPFT